MEPPLIKRHIRQRRDHIVLVDIVWIPTEHRGVPEDDMGEDSRSKEKEEGQEGDEGGHGDRLRSREEIGIMDARPTRRVEKGVEAMQGMG